MRLPRPYIPYRLRVQVAEREFKKRFGTFPGDNIMFGTGRTPLKVRLQRVLLTTFGDVKVHLDHDPALCNRKQFVSGPDGEFIIYEPAANDPDYLFYRIAEDHVTKTRVRGDHGQHSDLALARKRKRAEHKKKRPRSRLRGRGFDKSRTRKFSGQVVPRER